MLRDSMKPMCEACRFYPVLASEHPIVIRFVSDGDDPHSAAASRPYASRRVAVGGGANHDRSSDELRGSRVAARARGGATGHGRGRQFCLLNDAGLLGGASRSEDGRPGRPAGSTGNS